MAKQKQLCVINAGQRSVNKTCNPRGHSLNISDLLKVCNKRNGTFVFPLVFTLSVYFLSLSLSRT